MLAAAAGQAGRRARCSLAARRGRQRARRSAMGQTALMFAAANEPRGRDQAAAGARRGRRGHDDRSSISSTLRMPAAAGVRAERRARGRQARGGGRAAAGRAPASRAQYQLQRAGRPRAVSPPLHFAARQGHVDVGEALVEPAPTSTRSSAGDKTSPLLMRVDQRPVRPRAAICSISGADPNLAERQRRHAALRRAQRPVGARRRCIRSRAPTSSRS